MLLPSYRFYQVILNQLDRSIKHKANQLDRGVKHKAITSETKLEILTEVQKGFKKKDIVEKFWIPPSTLSTILKNKKEICESYQDSLVPPSIKRDLTGNYED